MIDRTFTSYKHSSKTLTPAELRLLDELLTTLWCTDRSQDGTASTGEPAQGDEASSAIRDTLEFVRVLSRARAATARKVSAPRGPYKLTPVMVQALRYLTVGPDTLSTHTAAALVERGLVTAGYHHGITDKGIDALHQLDHE